MKVTPLSIPDVLLIEPEVFGDERGFFFESFNQKKFEAAVGRQINFVQDNHSLSAKNVLRGLHYQIQQPQGKLVRVIRGEIFDVAVDIRKFSKTFGCWISEKISADNKRQLWIPEGFAHGFLVLSNIAEVAYKTSDYYASTFERSIIWNDPTLQISWPVLAGYILSPKDLRGTLLSEAEVFP